MRIPLRRCVVISFLSAMAATGQTPKQASSAPEPDIQLIADDAHYHVSRIALARGEHARIRHRQRDAILVVLASNSLSLATSGGSPPENLADGEVRFLKIGAEPMLWSTSDNQGQALIVELKQHWEPEVLPCAQPKKCTHSIRTGPTEIGETTQLFGNGFITAYRHQLLSGGTLTSSYFSAKGVDHVLLIALTELRANFDGTDETLDAGQVYPSEASEVEIIAGPKQARWVVIRVETPKS